MRSPSEADVLPDVPCQIILNPIGRRLRVLVTPENLGLCIPGDLDEWSLAVEFRHDIHTPLFDCERVVYFRRSERFPWRASDEKDIDANINGFQPGIYHYVHLGPGWESRSVDLYWGLLRKLISLAKEVDPMLAMVYESALNGTK